MNVLLITVLISGTVVFAETNELDRIMSAQVGLGANDLGDVVWDGSSLWVAGSGTLSKYLWGDGNRATDWISYRDMPGFGSGSMSAIYAADGIFVTAWTYTGEYAGDPVSYGDGISISTDSGETWRHVPVGDIFTDRGANAGYFTITYDIARSGNIIWAATTSGFLLSTSNIGLTWQRYLPNSADMDSLNLQNPNHHGQTVDAYGDTVWVGTFQGINLSVNRGGSWKNFSWPTEPNVFPTEPMPGNFCRSVEHKVVDGVTHVWVGSDDYFGKGQKSICHTADNGQTWEYATTDYTAHNFAFGHSGANNPAVSDSTVYATTFQGLIVSHDLGKTWSLLEIRESDDIYWEPGKMVYGIATVGDTLWVTSSDGIARTTDWGETWRIFNGVTRVKTLDGNDRNVGISSQFDDVKTYAFPNPFTPRRHDPDYSRTRIQYALSKDAGISIDIQDYAGNVIRRMLEDEFRTGGRDYREVWDGKDDTGNIVPNGVYFFIIRTNKGDTARGKIMVLD